MSRKADYYAQVVYIQDTDTIAELDQLRNAGKYDELLDYVEYWDECQECEVSEVYTTSTPYPYENLIAEDSEYALVHNWYTGDYILYRKWSEAQFQEADELENGELTLILQQCAR